MLIYLKKNLHDFSKILQLNAVGSGLLLIIMLFEVVFKSLTVGNIFCFFLSFLFLKTYFFSLKRLQYTYWSFSIVALLVSAYFFSLEDLESHIPLYLFYIIKIIEIYFASSPIYFPFSNWWEYDFRYRSDLKASFSFSDCCYEGRVSDIRRNAACLTAFEKLPIGSLVVISLRNGEINTLTIEGKVISIRETSLGRGYVYGISFSWDGSSNHEYFQQMRSFWQREKKNNKREIVEQSNGPLQ